MSTEDPNERSPQREDSTSPELHQNTEDHEDHEDHEPHQPHQPHAAHQPHQPGTEQPASERIRILNMVADGRLTAEQAAQLLVALAPEPAGVGAATRGRGWTEPRGAHRPPGAPAGPGGDFTVRVPPPPGPFPFSVPLPPVPPMPPGPPGPPLHQTAAARSLLFDVRDGERRVNARLPFGLAASADRFLPRQVKQALEEFEVDLGQLLEIVNSMNEPTMEDRIVLGPATLLDIREDERRIIVSTE